MIGRRRLATLIALPVILALGGLVTLDILAGRRGEARGAQDEQEIKPPQRVSMVNGEAVITLDTAAQRADGIETRRFSMAPHAEPLRGFGTVLDLQALTDLSNAYLLARAQVRAAQSKLAASAPAFERAQKLYQDEQNISAAQLQAAQATLHADQASLAAAQAQLHTLAATARQTFGMALSRSLIDATPLVSRLIAQQEILLQVTLRPGQVAAQPPARAFVQLDDTTRVPLQFISVAPRTDPRIQGPSFLFAAPAGAGLLPGMSVVAFLPTAASVQATVIPSSAIVWAQGQAWAYFRTGSTSFTRRAVATDMPATADGYLVRAAPDAEVVVQGAQMLLSEEFRAQIQVSD